MNSDTLMIRIEIYQRVMSWVSLRIGVVLCWGFGNGEDFDVPFSLFGALVLALLLAGLKARVGCGF